MRQIARIDDPKLASRFAAYLITKGIDTSLDVEEKGSIVWVRDENHVDEARLAYEKFHLNPHDTCYNGVEREAVEVRLRERERRERAKSNVVTMGQKWRAPTARRAPFTMVLIGACVLLTIATRFGGTQNPGSNGSDAAQRESKIWNQLSFAGPRTVVDGEVNNDPMAAIMRGEIWRLVTPIFVHLAWWHLAFNCLWAYSVGTMLEDRKGTPFLIVFCLVAAVVSNVSQALIENPNFAGLSGVGYALMGYAWMKSRFDPASGIHIERQQVYLFLFWFVLCIVSETLRAANAAHGAGLAVGVAWGYLPHLFRRHPSGSPD